MILSTILTSPTARVYNLRILLLANIPLMVLFGRTITYYDPFYAGLYVSHVLVFSCSIVTCVHHILAYAILFFIDLITYGGQYIQMADAWSGLDRFGDRCD
jgi:hypothetical protein